MKMRRYRLIVDDEPITVEIDREGSVRIDGQPLAADLARISDRSLYALLVEGIPYEAFVCAAEGAQYVVIDGQRYDVHWTDDVATACLTDLCPKEKAELRAPLPGAIVDVGAKVGQSVSKEQLILTLESMKMELPLKSPIAGVVSSIDARRGEQVAQGQTLAVIEGK